MMLATVTFLSGCPPLFPTPTTPSEPGPGSSPAIARGLNMDIEQVTIPVDRRPVVIFTLKDDLGNPVPLNELNDLRFSLAYLDDAPMGGGATRLVSYSTQMVRGFSQVTQDPARLNGATELSGGKLRYRFENAIPFNFDRNITHQVGAQARRVYPVDGTQYPTEAIMRFRPDGRAVTATREVVSTETCNQCHTRLEFHGGFRREVQHCMMCHNSQTFDSRVGQSLDFAEMIHKIHHGVELPSVQDGENYRLARGDYSSVAFPQDIRNCAVCHTDAPQAEIYLTQPTMAGCVACHDRTWFGNRDEMPANFTMHIGGQQVNDNLCAQCHTPTAPGSSPIFEAHLRPRESNAAPGLDFEIVDIEILPLQGTAGQLRITFFAWDKDGFPYTNLSELNAAGATLAFPAPEFEVASREPIVGGGGPRGTLVSNANGSHTYSFDQALQGLPGETYAVAMDGRVSFSFRGQNFNQGTATNSYLEFTADGSQPSARRAIVEDQSCNACHGEIRFHGESRVGVQLCVMCHNPNASDIARRPGNELPPETVNFKDMIHRIHRGEDLINDYTVYGFGNVAHNFNDVRFPGKLQECSICHTPGSQHVPLPHEVLSTQVTLDGEIVRDILPERAACTSCHDSLITNVHAMLATDTNGVETCATCHAPGSSFSVEAVHRLRP